MLNPPKELNLWIVVILMVIASACTGFAQKHYKVKYILTDSVSKPVKVLMDFGKVKQVGYLYCDTLYFIRYSHLVRVKKEVKSFEKL